MVCAKGCHQAFRTSTGLPQDFGNLDTVMFGAKKACTNTVYK